MSQASHNTARIGWGEPFAAAFFIAIAGSIPYLYGQWSTPPGQQFMGMVGRGTTGTNEYYMLARQVAEGHDLVANYLTPEHTERAYFSFEWWLYGTFARLTGLSLEAVFHVERIAVAFAFAFAVWWLVCTALREAWRRRAAFVLILFGSGFGVWAWLKAHFGLHGLPMPLDVDGVTVPAYLVNKPHFIVAGVFAALQYAFLLRGMRNNAWREFVFAGLAMSAQSAIRPFHVPETYAVCLLVPALLSYQKRRVDTAAFARFGLALAVHTPMLCYLAYVFLANPLRLGPLTTEPVLLLMQIAWLGAPFLLVVAYFACRGAAQVRHAAPPALLLGLWLVTAWLVTMSFPIVRWSHESLFAYVLVPPILAMATPLDVLAAMCMRAVPRFNIAKLQRMLALLLVLAGLPGTAFGYARFFHRLHHPDANWVYYLDKGYVSAFEWLKQNSTEGEVVLASESLNTFIPRAMDRRVVAGHYHYTPDFEAKRQQTLRFYAGRGDDAFKRWMLNTYHVRYVLLGPFERKNDGLDPREHAWLEHAAQFNGVEIYRVRP